MPRRKEQRRGINYVKSNTPQQADEASNLQLRSAVGIRPSHQSPNIVNVKFDPYLISAPARLLGSLLAGI